MAMEPPQAPRPPLPRPSVSRARTPQGGLKLGHVVIGVTVLLVLAWAIGNRSRQPAAPAVAETPSVETASPARVAVVKARNGRGWPGSMTRR